MIFVFISLDDKFTDIAQYPPLIPPTQDIEAGGEGDHTVSRSGPQPRSRQAVPGGCPGGVETDQEAGRDVVPTSEMFSANHHNTAGTGRQSVRNISPQYTIVEAGGFSLVKLWGGMRYFCFLIAAMV